jgi:hypothetical protein
LPKVDGSAASDRGELSSFRTFEKLDLMGSKGRFGIGEVKEKAINNTQLSDKRTFGSPVLILTDSSKRGSLA